MNRKQKNIKHNSESLQPKGEGTQAGNQKEQKGKNSPFTKGGQGDSTSGNENENYKTPPDSNKDNEIQERYLLYNKKLKQFSRNLRNDSTKAEIFLWKQLRAAALGYTFNRQKPILNYIVDFYCKPLHLVIEADGISHWDEDQQEKDKIRQEKLENSGLHFLRFDDDEILNDMENVLRTISITIEELEKNYPEAVRRKKNPPDPL